MDTKTIAYFNIPEEYKEYTYYKHMGTKYDTYSKNILTLKIPSDKCDYFDFIKSKYEEGLPVILELVNIIPSLELSEEGTIYALEHITIIYSTNSIAEVKLVTK